VILKKLRPQDEPRQYLLQAQDLLAKGDYEAALEENQKVLSLAAYNPPGDEALYNIGLIYAHPGNPKRDYVKSIAFFDRVISDYSQSRWFIQAKVWAEILRESEELKRAPTAVKEEPRDLLRQYLLQAQDLLAKGDYEAALEENQKVLSLAANNPLGDEALYNTGLIYAHPGNPKRDYVKSIVALKRLGKEYPQSPWTEQGKIWAQVLQENENSKRVAVTVAQENDKLKRIIEESRKVDIEIEEKKREKAR
jgi:outer membrane protein assembly factor BamD (BamD/ComL family)